MKVVNYVDALNIHYASQGNPPYKWTINDAAPLHTVGKPLNECRVSMLVSGGVSECSMPAFNPNARNDHRLDAIDNGVATDAFQIHDSYYDHTDAESDINCIFPIDRLRELDRDGEIGEIAPRLWSGFMGRIYNRSKVVNESAPAFADALMNDEVDLLVASPS